MQIIFDPRQRDALDLFRLADSVTPIWPPTWMGATLEYGRRAQILNFF